MEFSQSKEKFKLFESNIISFPAIVTCCKLKFEFCNPISLKTVPSLSLIKEFCISQFVYSTVKTHSVVFSNSDESI